MSEQVYIGYPQTQTPEQTKKPQDIDTMFSNIASQVPEAVYSRGTHEKPYILHDDPSVGTVGIAYWGNHQFLMRAWAAGDENCWVQKVFEYRFDSAHRANRLFALETVPLEYAETASVENGVSAKLENIVDQLHDGFHETRQQAHDNVLTLLGVATLQEILPSA